MAMEPIPPFMDFGPRQVDMERERCQQILDSLFERRHRLLANLQHNPYQKHEIESQLRSVDAEIRSVNMQLGQQPGLPPAPHAMHQPVPMQHQHHHHHHHQQQQQQSGQSPLSTSDLTTERCNVCVSSTGGPSQAMMGYGGPAQPPMYECSSHVSPGDSGINTKAPSVVADGDLEREDMMDQKPPLAGISETEKRVKESIFPGSLHPNSEAPGTTRIFPNQQTNLEQLARPSQMVKTAIANLINYQDNTELVTRSLPELTQLLSDSDPGVLAQAAQVAQQLTKKDASRHAIVNNPSVVSALVHAMASTNDAEVQRSSAGALHSISTDKTGILAIYQCGGITYLVRLLSSPVTAVVFYAVTTLHNMLLHHEPSRMAVRTAGGIEKLVSLLTRDNVKFLAVCTDCLQLLAFKDQESKLIILQSQGPAYLVRLMRLYTYEKLLFTCTRILKVLSACPNNKMEIVKAGGMQVLAMHLGHRSNRLVLNILITLRNLSDTANRMDHLDELIRACISLLSSNDLQIVAYVLGTLSNLTCNNAKNKVIVTQLHGVQAILHILLNVKDREDVIEPAVCTLRHLTTRHVNAEMAQVVLRDNYGIPVLVNFLQPHYKWPLIKVAFFLPTNDVSLKHGSKNRAVVGLVRNLALSFCNHAALRDEGCLPKLVHLMNKAYQDLDQRSVQGGPPGFVGGVYMEEIIQGVVAALHILAKDPHNRAIIHSLNCIPLFITLLHSTSEPIQRVCAGVLCEMVQYPEAAQDMEKENATAPLLELMNSRNETVAAFAHAILFRLSGDKQSLNLPHALSLPPSLGEDLFDLDFPLEEPTAYADQSTPARYHSNPGSGLNSPLGTPHHPHQIPRPFHSMPASATHSMPPSAPHSMPASAPHSLPPSAPHSLPPSNPQSMPGSGTQTPVHPYMQGINQFGPEMDLPLDPHLEYHPPPSTSGVMYNTGPMHSQPHQFPRGMHPHPSHPSQQTMTVHHHPSTYNPRPAAGYMHPTPGPPPAAGMHPHSQPHPQPHPQQQFHNYHPPSPAVHDMSPAGNPWFEGGGTMDM